MDLDSFQEEIGGISRYQVVLIITVSFITFGQVLTSQAPVFISAVPSFRLVSLLQSWLQHFGYNVGAGSSRQQPCPCSQRLNRSKFHRLKISHVISALSPTELPSSARQSDDSLSYVLQL